jgi:hypothetical protein
VHDLYLRTLSMKDVAGEPEKAKIIELSNETSILIDLFEEYPKSSRRMKDRLDSIIDMIQKIIKETKNSELKSKLETFVEKAEWLQRHFNNLPTLYRKITR